MLCLQRTAEMSYEAVEELGRRRVEIPPSLIRGVF